MVAYSGPRQWVKLAVSVIAVFTCTSARAGRSYSIVDLGVLPGTTASAARSINNQGQVVGVSYTPDATSASPDSERNNPTAHPYTNFTGAGASDVKSFLYSSGVTSEIHPSNGMATAINDAGQVVGGNYIALNNAGQYVTGNILIGNTNDPVIYLAYPNSGIQNDPSMNRFLPYAMNDSGVMVGETESHDKAGFGSWALDHGKFIRLPDGQPIAINDRNEIIANQNGHSLFYSINNARNPIDLTAISGNPLWLAQAMNNKGDVVGNGFLYSNGVFSTLESLVTAPGGWSDLNADGINDRGQIVGQGLIDGKEHAFLMNPDAAVPEPTTATLFCLMIVAIYAHRKLSQVPAQDRAIAP